jgi:hypothetical protein
MQTLDPSTPLLALNGSPIRRIAVDWRDTLRTVGTMAARAPTASVAQLLDAAGKAIEGAEGAGMTLGDAALDALLTGKASEECTGTEKLRRWELALKFRGGGPVSLLAEEVMFVDACLAQVFKASVYGPARDALNGVTR